MISSPNPHADRAERPFQISRRSFVHRCAAIAAATGIPVWFLERTLDAAERPKKLAANDRPGVALIGCGGQGKVDTANAANFGNIVAVCDVNAERAAEAVTRFTVDGRAPVPLGDFRRVLDRPDVHAIINGTPDHWHTLVNLAAVRSGRDVYSEKPLTLTIDEGKRLVKEVRKRKAVLQTGSQQRSIQRFRLACELARNQRIGKLESIDVWLPAGLREGPFQAAAVPEGLNWDFWLGQAPKVDYSPERGRASFRWWYDYSGGTMTDWGAHHNDIARWAIGLNAPGTIEGKPLTEPIPGGYTTHSQYDITYTFANGVPVRVRSTTDDNTSGGKVREGQANGVRLNGSSGWIWVNRDKFTASDLDIIRTPLPATAEHLEVSANHTENFFDCMRSRKAPICDVETGHRSASMCHLGVIALRTGCRLTWDGDKERFVGTDADRGNAYLSRPMRAPYNYSFAG